MTRDELDLVIQAWASDGPDRGPRGALERALSATGRVRQRPAWAFPARWLPRPVADLELRAPLPLKLALVLGLLVALLLTSSLLLSGSPSTLRSLLGPSFERLIAFQEGAAVYVSRPDGAERQLLSGEVPFARSPLFSPDGSRVAFVAPASADALGGRLLVVPVDHPDEVVDVGQGMDVLSGEVSSVAWSPDGEQLAFSALVDGVATIVVAASDGSGATAITDQSADRDLPTWSPDGSLITFRETNPDGERRALRRMAPDGSEMVTINMMVAADSTISMLRWSPDSLPPDLVSMSYVMSPGYGIPTSALIDLGFGHMAELWMEGVGGLQDLGAPWSPDGQHLTFISSDGHVIVAADDPSNLDDGQPYGEPLRDLGPVLDCWVDWSPDGTALLGGSPHGCDSVVVVPLASPDASTTVPASGAGTASWQPLQP